MIDPVVRDLQDARIRLIMDWPIFGAFVLGLELKEVTWVDTAATDGRHFFYNREFIQQLDKGQLVFLTAHETLHCVYSHMFRRGDRDPDIWNCAADYVVNWLLLNNKDSYDRIKPIGTVIENVPPVTKILYDPKFDDRYSVEELYLLLAKTYSKKQISQLGRPVDQHLDYSQAGHDSPCNEDGPPRYSPEDIESIRDTITSTLLQTLQQTDIEPGSLPAGLRRMLDALTTHKINWRHMLDTVLRSSLRHDYTYTRLSRRCWITGLTLPGQEYIEKITVYAFMDASGSTTQQMITDFLSECRGILMTFPDFEITLGSFDTKVYNIKTFTPDNVDEIDAYTIKGGGGTSLSCCWKWLQTNHIVPDRLLIFTDGYVGDDWGDRNYCHTTFIVHSNPTAQPSHGVVLHYDGS